MAVEEPRLPLPRKPREIQIWGALLNKFLRVAHNEDGTLKDPGTFDSLSLTGNIEVSGTGKFKRILAGGVDS